MPLPSAIAARLDRHDDAALAARFRSARGEEVAARIYARDDRLWGPPGQPEVADRLGWLGIADRMAAELDDLRAFAASVRADGLRHAVVLGMGGSSLAPEVFRRSFGTRDGGLLLHVLDSTDPAAVRDLEAAIDPDDTLFVVSSKSGTTIETTAALARFWRLSGERGDRFVAITDPGTPLAALAARRRFRRIFLNDPEIGGRYSALSYVGLVPAALAGADLDELVGRAVALGRELREEDPEDNPGLWLGCVLGELARRRRDKLTFLVDPSIASFGLWVEQLVAESLGKRGVGIVPVADEPVGAPEAYGNDRVFLHLHDDEHARDDSALGRLAEAGLPVIALPVSGPEDLGRLMLLLEFATAVAGWVLGVNPFDQPNVQAAKDKTAEVLAGEPPRIKPGGPEALRALLDAGPPSYLAIQAYLPPSPALDGAIADLRAEIRDRTMMATTFGYGPRYLHSTGQLHKGGPPVGRFLQLVAEHEADIPVPGEPYTFGALERAQADGDLLVLREQGLPVERIVVRGDPVEAVRRLEETL